MIKELKKIREELLLGVDNEDLLYIKMQINNIDTLIHKTDKANKKIIELTEYETKEFKANLKVGFGFTTACNHIFKSVKDVSILYHKNSSFKAMCQDSIRQHINGFLNMGQAAMSNMDFEEFVKNNGYLTRFIIRLTTWEEFCRKRDVTEKKLMKAIYLYRYPEEVETACGFGAGEMYDFISKYEKLSLFVETIGFIN